MAENYRASAFLPRDAHRGALVTYEDEARHQRMVQDKERDRHLMHQQVRVCISNLTQHGFLFSPLALWDATFCKENRIPIFGQLSTLFQSYPFSQ